MSDFKPNKLGFNARGCYEAIRRIASEEMDKTADKMIEIIQKQIDYLGNGTKAMKWAAKQTIRKIIEDLYNPIMSIEVGFDENYAQNVSFQFYVRALVVLYGNQNEGTLTTKPGRNTFKKEVFGYGKSGAESVYLLPDGFNQESVMPYIKQNSLNEINKHFKDMMNNIESRCDAVLFGSFITGG